MHVTNEETTVEFGLAAPEAPGGQIKHETAAQPGDVSPASPDGRCLPHEPPGPVPVVVIPVGNDVAASQLARLVAHGTDAPLRQRPSDQVRYDFERRRLRILRHALGDRNPERIATEHF